MESTNDGTLFADNTTFNPNSALLIVANTWERLRRCDVERLICDVAGKDHAPEMVEAIKKNRGDLLPEAMEAWDYLRSDA